MFQGTFVKCQFQTVMIHIKEEGGLDHLSCEMMKNYLCTLPPGGYYGN